MGLFPKSKWITAFAVISLVQAAIVLAMELYVFVIFQRDVEDHLDENSNTPNGSKASATIPTFLALYIFAFVYQLLLVWDAIRMKNTIQIIGLVGLNIGLLLYGAVQNLQMDRDSLDQLRVTPDVEAKWKKVQPFLIVIPCVLGVTTILLAFVAYKLYNEFAWTIYKHISADLRMKRRYLTYQIYVALLKFDVFFCLGFTIQFIIIVRGRDGKWGAEAILTACSIPVTIAIMLAAFWFVRRESLVGTICVMVLYFAGMAYFIFKFSRMYMPNFRDPYLPARTELTTFAVLTIILMAATIVYASMCAHNYGRGLKPYIMHSNTKAVVGPDDRPAFDEVHGQQSNYNRPTSYAMQNDSYPQKPGMGRANVGRMEID